MGRTALYRDYVPFSSARAEVHLDADTIGVHLPDGRVRRHDLDGCVPSVMDGVVTVSSNGFHARRFVRMLVLERSSGHDVFVTPPELGAVAPNVVRVPETPADAAVLDTPAWEALTEWVVGGGRFAGCAIADLARLVTIATPQFAVLIGEVAAQRALELASASRGPLRSTTDLDTALQPFVEAARRSPRAAEALVSALAHAAGATRRRRRYR